MAWVRRGTLLLTAFFGLPAMAASADTADFTYEAGHHAEGLITGACEGAALVPPQGRSGQFDFLADGATLRRFTTWVNYTLLLPESGLPVRMAESVVQVSEDTPLASGPIGVTWNADARAIILEDGAYLAPGQPFDLGLSALTLRTGPVAPGAVVLEVWEDEGPGGVVPYAGGVEGLARRVDAAQATYALQGDATMHLEGATISAGGVATTLPPGFERHASSTPGLVLVSEVYRHALLYLTGAHLDTNLSGLVAYCRGIDWSIQGAFTAHAATGRVDKAGQGIDFSNRALTLAGNVHVVDAPAPGTDARPPAHGQADGEFLVVGLDFGAAPVDAIAPWRRAAAGAVGIATLVAVLAVAGHFLYTRLKEEEILGGGERARLYDTIQSNPGIAFRDLLRLCPTSATNARYHLLRLERVGHIRRFELRGRHHYTPRMEATPSLRRAALVAKDSRLGALLAFVGPERFPAAHVVEYLRRTCGLSRSGSWKVLERAAREQLVAKQDTPGGMIVRRLDT